ncbi:MAG: TraR/DksA C4-type zinc finger protein [Prevotellaceae bacterium]|nr:TraR/DksA C4-type zinc finger protein [Prevotellaceae bacterium]
MTKTAESDTDTSQSPRIRYSDTDLAEFKQRILERLEKERGNFELLKSTISHGGSNDTEDTSPSFKVLEDGAATLSKEESGQQLERIKKFILDLERALVRIENKTYGICRETGKLISKERLFAVPHATLSIEAKNKR